MSKSPLYLKDSRTRYEGLEEAVNKAQQAQQRGRDVLQQQKRKDDERAQAKLDHHSTSLHNINLRSVQAEEGAAPPKKAVLWNVKRAPIAGPLLSQSPHKPGDVPSHVRQSDPTKFIRSSPLRSNYHDNQMRIAQQDVPRDKTVSSCTDDDSALKWNPEDAPTAVGVTYDRSLQDRYQAVNEQLSAAESKPVPDPRSVAELRTARRGIEELMDTHHRRENMPRWCEGCTELKRSVALLVKQVRVMQDKIDQPHESSIDGASPFSLQLAQSRALLERAHEFPHSADRKVAGAEELLGEVDLVKDHLKIFEQQMLSVVTQVAHRTAIMEGDHHQLTAEVQRNAESWSSRAQQLEESKVNIMDLPQRVLHVVDASRNEANEKVLSLYHVLGLDLKMVQIALQNGHGDELLSCLPPIARLEERFEKLHVHVLDVESQLRSLKQEGVDIRSKIEDVVQPPSAQWTAKSRKPEKVDLLTLVGFEVEENGGMLLVTYVAQGRSAHALGICAGDRITHVNSVSIDTLAGFHHLAAQTPIGGSNTLRIGRKGSPTVHLLPGT